MKAARMKRMAGFLIRMYPANWRVRYGEEFEALLEDSAPDWRSIFDLLKGAIRMQFSVPSFPKLALALSLTGLLAGLAISFAVASRYVSTATLQFTAPVVHTNPPEVHRNVNEYFLQLRTEILSRTSLSSIIQDPRLDLYPAERAKIPLEDVIEQMRRDIQIMPTAPGSGPDYLPFILTFTYRDRLKAQQTVQALTTKFEDSNIISQRAQVREKRAVKDDQIYRLEARIAALEKRLGVQSVGHERDFSSYSDSPLAGVQLQVLDPPSLPTHAIYPDHFRFMALGFGGGIGAAILIAIVRKRPPIPLPAQTA
ncbi:MAG TPA: hypothetical protein VGL82_07990 [Bryobacteraceae bacterium]